MHPRLVKLVKDGLWEDDLTVFEYWRIHGTKIPERQLADLLGSDNDWTNVLAYTTFPKRRDRRWIDGC